MLREATGYDDADPYSRSAPFGHLRRGAMPDTPRIAVAAVLPACDDAVLAGYRRATGLFDTMPVDIAPFLEMARLLYDGPWVAERTAALRTIIQTQPDALHAVTRAILEAGFARRTIDAFDAFDRLAQVRRIATRLFGAVDALLLPTAPFCPDSGGARSRPDRTERPARHVHQLRQSLRPCRHRRPRRVRPGRDAGRRDADRAGLVGRTTCHAWPTGCSGRLSSMSAQRNCRCRRHVAPTRCRRTKQRCSASGRTCRACRSTRNCAPLAAVSCVLRGPRRTTVFTRSARVPGWCAVTRAASAAKSRARSGRCRAPQSACCWRRSRRRSASAPSAWRTDLASASWPKRRAWRTRPTSPGSAAGAAGSRLTAAGA